MDNNNAAPRVLIVLDAASAWSRGVLRGFTAVARQKRWRLLHYHPMTDIKWLVDVWQPAAVVLQASLHENVKALSACVVVSVNDDCSERGIASICLDEAAIGKLAANHLLATGLTKLATFRFNDGLFALERERSFRRAVADNGAQVVPGWWVDGVTPRRSVEDPAALVTWVTGLPRPCGLFACTDSWARIAARYAEVAGVRVPEDIALIGVDNDIVDCELASPPLSSVAVPWLTVGQQAAALAEQALAGKAIAGQRVVIAPVDVIPRRSTDVTAIDDPVVARAVSWIVEHATQRVTLNAVARAAACSRQRLEQRFRAALGRTVMQEVRRVRSDEAKRLLSTTKSTLDIVAKRCGFADAAALSVAFRRQTGMPPGTYRRKCRGLDATED